MRSPTSKSVEAVNADTAFHAGADFVHFVLEAADGCGETLVTGFLAAHDADFAAGKAPLVTTQPATLPPLERAKTLRTSAAPRRTSLVTGSRRPAMTVMTSSISS
jgi:hypothetical protein